jgi:hypothetical protein
MLTFQECVDECLGNPEFVRGFDRITQSSLGPGEVRSPMAALVDQATGFDEIKRNQDHQKFVAFVYETVWCRLPAGAKDPTQVVEPPPGGSIEELLGVRENTSGE